jgi:DNA mismatch repair protein MutS2
MAHVELKAAPGSTARGSINLIGKRVDEAVAELTRFIDNAHLAGLEVVEVIHGMGTGALKKAVAEHLKSRREVKSFEPGPPEAGGAGVTVVYLR